MTGGPDASRRPKTASADCHRARNLTVFFDGERGRFFPTALMQSSLWHSCRDLWIRSPPHEPSLVLQSGRAPRFWSGVRVGEYRDCQDRHYRRLVKADAS